MTYMYPVRGIKCKPDYIDIRQETYYNNISLKMQDVKSWL